MVLTHQSNIYVISIYIYLRDIKIDMIYFKSSLSRLAILVLNVSWVEGN